MVFQLLSMIFPDLLIPEDASLAYALPHLLRSAAKRGAAADLARACTCVEDETSYDGAQPQDSNTGYGSLRRVCFLAVSGFIWPYEVYFRSCCHWLLHALEMTNESPSYNSSMRDDYIEYIARTFQGLSDSVEYTFMPWEEKECQMVVAVQDLGRGRNICFTFQPEV